MRPLLPIALILLAPVVYAQTTLDITLPGGATCSYPTGAVSNGSVSGHLQATATTNPTGAGCGGTGSSSSVTFGPASLVSATAVQVYNGTSSISFQAANATSCTGTITPATGSFSNGSQLCSSSTTCQPLITATAQFDNESTTQTQAYAVAVTCAGTSGPPAISQTIVNVPAKGVVIPPDGCYSIANSKASGAPFTRMTGNISTNRNDGVTVNRDSTSFDSVFFTTTAPHWPGQKGLTTNLYLPTNNYVALAFSVPTGFFETAPNNTGVYGQYSLNASAFSRAFVAMSISSKCGDFSSPGGSSTALCVANNMWSDDLIQWTSAAGSACRLQSGKTYYLNIINASVEGVLPNGGGTATSTASANCTGNKCVVTPTIGPSNTWTYPK